MEPLVMDGAVGWVKLSLIAIKGWLKPSSIWVVSVSCGGSVAVLSDLGFEVIMKEPMRM